MRPCAGSSIDDIRVEGMHGSPVAIIMILLRGWHVMHSNHDRDMCRNILQGLLKNVVSDISFAITELEMTTPCSNEIDGVVVEFSGGYFQCKNTVHPSLKKLHGFPIIRALKEAYALVSECPSNERIRCLLSIGTQCIKDHIMAQYDELCKKRLVSKKRTKVKLGALKEECARCGRILGLEERNVKLWNIS